MDPTKRYRKYTNKSIKETLHNLRKRKKYKKYTEINPQAPTMKILTKLHKKDIPIRLVVNYK